MGFATILATMAMIFVFASMIVFGATLQKSITQASVQQSERQQGMLAASKQSISISATAYVFGAIVPWTADQYSDFSQGATANATVQGAGSVTLTGPSYTNGTYTSNILDSGVAGTNFSTISWTSIEPANTDISFQVRSENSTAALLAAPFAGPDGTASTFYMTSSSNLNASVSNNRYGQYRAYLWTNDTGSTPELQAVSIAVTRPVGHVFVNVTNTGIALTPSNTDVYVAGVRVSRNDSVRSLTLVDVAEESLWNGDEDIEIVVYQTIGAPARIIVANVHAEDESVVFP